MFSESYYDYALEQTSEIQKVTEALMTPKFASCIEEATKEQISELKSNAMKSINEFVSNTIDKTCKQIDIIESKVCTPDLQLISLCEQKIKAMTSEECNATILKGTNTQDCINRAIEIVTKDCYLVDADIVDFCKGNLFNNYTSKIKGCSERLNEAVRIKSESVDVNFRDICNTIYEYRNFAMTNDCVLKSKESMSDSKIEVTSENAIEILNVIYESTDYLVKAKDVLTNLQIASFNNKEDILRRFIDE